METLGKYKIRYIVQNVTQHKNLISHKRYVEVKLLIEAASKNKELEKPDIKKIFGDDYFTDESPLFQAISSGILVLPPNQGGCHPCEIIEI